MSIGENIGYGLRAQKMPEAQITARVDEMLALIQLPQLRTANRANCPAASSSAWRWHARWPPGRRC